MKILLVEDEKLVLGAFTALVATFGDGYDVVQADSCAAALRWLSLENFDLVLLDLHLPDAAGLGALLRLRAAHPRARIVVLSGETDPVVINQALVEGARSYVTKNSSPSYLATVIQTVIGGGVVVPDAATRDIPRPPGFDKLTPRQRDVLSGLLDGKTNEAIATELGITANTVKEHRKELYRKLGVSDRVSLIKLAAKLGLLDSSI